MIRDAGAAPVLDFTDVTDSTDSTDFGLDVPAGSYRGRAVFASVTIRSRATEAGPSDRRVFPRP